ncbi:MAG: GIY-YIG nuclease family protein [Firmicutes bacterium]|nr:GIY-YIG nuclease family protein [Bacillota bacterium]
MSESFTYILLCADGSLYTGWTTDVPARLAAHNSGRGAKYTRGRLPVTLYYCERHGTREAAMSREWHLKRLSREQKLGLRGSESDISESFKNGVADNE